MKSPNFQLDAYGINSPNAIIFIIILFFSFNLFSQQLAFPIATGFGKYTTGGRGGAVIKVTNLNNNGSGSLRAALESTGTRTIVFEVGGTINLTSNIYVTNGNLTLAGQTAPGDGILIRGGMLQIETSNVIIRYLRVRPGSTAPSGADGISITAWGGTTVENIILDHISISWAKDENLNIRGVGTGKNKNITVQNSIISECSYGILIAGHRENITIYNNLFILNSERSIRTNFPDNGVFDFEMINNVIYGFKDTTRPSLGNKFTVLNNHYKKSNQITTYYTSSCVYGETSGQGTPSQTYAFISGNTIPSGFTESFNLNAYLQNSSFNSSGITPINAIDVYNVIKNVAGCSFPTRDSVDTGLLIKYEASTGLNTSTGTYPVLLNGTPPSDIDNDGMPDSWEIENGLDINNPSDRNIVQPDGYTNLEYYLNGLLLETNAITANAGTDISICEGQSTTLTASGGTNYIWNTSETTQSITVSPTATTTYSVTVSDTNGNSDTDDVIVTVNTLPTANAGNDKTICLGEATTLTATGGNTYLWNTGQTTQTITVNPNINTIYTVTVTQNGCESSDEVNIMVSELPTTNAGNDITIDEGENTILTASGGGTYLWNTGEITPSITVNPMTTTTYSVEVTNASGCTNEDEVIVTVNQITVNANAGTDISICEGESTTLTASGGNNYSWSTGETTQSIIVNPNATTNYSVIVSIGSITDTDDVIVTVNALPTANAGNDITIDEGENTVLTASGGGTYLWNTGETAQNITVNPMTTTTYSVEVTNASGCTNEDDVIVTVNQITVNANAGTDVSICEGESTTLTASGGNNYSWSTGENTQSITVNPNITTNYSVTVSIGNISDTDDVIVTVNALPTANAGNDITIDEGENTILTASGGGTYLWNTGEITPSITVNPMTTTTYSVVVTNASDCTNEDEVIVTVNQITVNANAGTDVSICEGESTILTASGGNNYSWSTGETTQSITVNPNITTNYSVTVSIGSITDTDDVIVTVNALPTVDAGNDVTIINGESTTLTATGGNSYLWNTGETTQNITVNPNITTTYIVTGNQNGCEDEDSITVFVESNVVASVSDDQSVCDGYAYEITLTASGGTNYLWNTGATTQSITVSPLSTTTYTVTVFDGNYQDDTDVTVFVDPNPEVVILNGDSETILEGEYITISASGANTYEWNNGATQPNIAVNPSITTTYEVTGYINECYETKELTVIVIEQVVAYAGESVSICLEESATLTATGGDEYIWNTGATTPTIIVSPDETTEYTVTVFNELDFDEATVLVEVDPQCNDSIIVDETPEFDFRIFPNPTTDILNVRMAGLYNTSKFYFYDVSGKVLLIEDIEETASGISFTKQIDLSSYSKGLYFLKIVYDDQELIEKVLIK